jgi:pimeloyl-ACP methyl ester carboxylesterase
VNQDLRRLLKGLSLPAPFVLVGHSFGGLIAQSFAIRYAELVCGVVLLDSGHPEQAARLQHLLTSKGRADLRRFRKAPNPERMALAFSEAQVGRSEHFPHVPLRVLTVPVPPDALNEFVHPQAALRVIAHMDQALSRLSPRGTLVKVPRTGHFIQLDRPDAVIRSIRAVVREVRRSRHWEERRRSR